MPASSTTAEWRAVGRYARQRGARSVAHEFVGALRANNVLTYGSAASFQILFALIPMLLAAVAILGFLDLSEVWNGRLAPRIRDAVSAPVYTVIDRSVTSVLQTQRTFWLTVGAALALWELSGAVRVAMGALNAIYGAEESRPFVRRLLQSIALAIALALLLGLRRPAFRSSPASSRTPASAISPRSQSSQRGCSQSC